MGEHVPECPWCHQHPLEYPVDIQRGCCIRCHLKAITWVNGTALEQDCYRSEADTYGEGIHDDD